MKNNGSGFPFELKKPKTAKVSAISEATALSKTDPSEKINFHIGNPLQDYHLNNLYYKLCTGDFYNDQKNSEFSEFLFKTIQKAVPYSPRNGFIKNQSDSLIVKLDKWLSSQHERLQYRLDQGECIIISGGVFEFLRIVISTLTRSAVNSSLKFICFGIDLPDYLMLPSLDFIIVDNEDQIMRQLDSEDNYVLLINRKISDEKRRSLRQKTAEKSILFCELNGEENHSSLARESGMQEQVIRFIPAHVFGEHCKSAAVGFVLGQPDFLKLLANMQFELKGTPSSTEIRLLDFLTDRKNQNFQNEEETIENEAYSGYYNVLESYAQKSQNLLNDKIDRFSKPSFIKPVSLFNKYLKDVIDFTDALENEKAESVFESLISDLSVVEELKLSFINHFVRHNPFYQKENCLVVSGSSRTGLSILGQFFENKTFFTFDYSWSYEHAFSNIKYISLTDFEYSSKELVSKVEQFIKEKQQTPVVILNNPHNASGSVFPEALLKPFLSNLLQLGVLIIDDLCYKDVSAKNIDVHFPTIKELAIELSESGYISAQSLENIITAHSLSKTDCFAGARLAVFEINEPQLFNKMKDALSNIRPNVMAIFLAYLFYRNEKTDVNNYYRKRNKTFSERASALTSVIKEIPAERNSFDIDITVPAGSMYPRLVINYLPYGISLEQLADKLAINGIGLIPMNTFTKTAEGFKNARNSFRLTLGGSDDAKQLEFKTRNLVIELNRLLREEQRLYKLKQPEKINEINQFNTEFEIFKIHLQRINAFCEKEIKTFCKKKNISEQEQNFLLEYLPKRLNTISEHFREKCIIYSNLIEKFQQGIFNLQSILSRELYKDNINERRKRFRQRLFDRTVHPTQMYSISVDFYFKNLMEMAIFNQAVSDNYYEKIGRELLSEFFGENVPVNSEQEAIELVFDLNAMIECEWLDSVYNDDYEPLMLSFWSDWDGSTRPSGQGHRLVAAVIIENVRQMASILTQLINTDDDVKTEQQLLKKIQNLESGIADFWELLNKITGLTNQLEKRYQGIYKISQPAKTKFLKSLRFKKDPIKKLSQHNDNLEKRMLKLRQKRSQKLNYYFSLNKQLRKELNRLIPFIIKHDQNKHLILSCLKYRNLLNRFTVTPRIHQKMITATDSFAVETTVKNLLEINELGAFYGNPGVVMALQISMSTDPKSLIRLDRLIEKVAQQQFKNEDIFRLWLIPLFEDQKTIDSVFDYLNEVFKYAQNTYPLNQTPPKRMAEIICEIFIAGSDLSQQIGSAQSSYLYRRTKAHFYQWLTDRNLVDDIRIKLGSGETAQRQNGHIRDYSGASLLKYNPSLINLKDVRIAALNYAVTPLSGLHASGDLRTIQSTASEKIFRLLSVEKRYELFQHLKKYQNSIQNEIKRISILGSSRLDMTQQIVKEFKRISQLYEHPLIDLFLENTANNFRKIVYGEEDDIFGIHVASYFISRTLPVLRDRPIVRPPRDLGLQAGQRIVERLAQTLPLSKYGSLLRAIGHNQAQTMVLGIDQLSCGIFRSLKVMKNENNIKEADWLYLFSQLPVYEILNNLRLYYDYNLIFFDKIATAFNPGNKSLKALFEDRNSINEYIPYLQKELLRRHGLDPEDYFYDNIFEEKLLHLLRPDIAVLLQKDIFNTNPEFIHKNPSNGKKFREKKIDELIQIPVKVRYYREKIWSIIEKKVYQQISGFSDLAVALTTLEEKVPETGFNQFFAEQNRFSLNPQKGDSMQLFLLSVMDFLTKIPRDDFQVPIDVLRTISDVKEIIKIDEQALSETEQEMLRFNLLQMARITGENG